MEERKILCSSTHWPNIDVNWSSLRTNMTLFQRVQSTRYTQVFLHFENIANDIDVVFHVESWFRRRHIIVRSSQSWNLIQLVIAESAKAFKEKRTYHRIEEPCTNSFGLGYCACCFRWCHSWGIDVSSRTGYCVTSHREYCYRKSPSWLY